MNNEIKRLIRSLDEACAEQGITIDLAVSWYKTIETHQPIPIPKKKAFRNIAVELVSSSSLDKPKSKNICVEILCMAHEAGEKVLHTEDIVNQLLKNNLIPEKDSGRTIAKKYIYEFLTDYYKKQGISNPRNVIGKESWRSICFALRNLVKTLN